MDDQFAKDVDRGLSSDPKTLSSKYFYDAEGDRIFQQIMNMPEYYLTNCEHEIFDGQKQQILEAVYSGKKLNLVELGAGDGYKTKVLLRYFLYQEVDFKYLPVDISAHVLKQLEEDLKNEFPQLEVNSLNTDYFAALKKLNELDASPKLILFLGSNLGNFSVEGTRSFLQGLFDVMNSGDQLLCGIDLKKRPKTILKAYDDESGITKSFNINLLKRINRELDGDFDIANFEHYATYDPLSGEARSYLMSVVEQEVQIKALNKSYSFQNSEPVLTERSRKYSLEEIEALADSIGFSVKCNFTDSQRYYVDSLWTKK